MLSRIPQIIVALVIVLIDGMLRGRFLASFSAAEYAVYVASAATSSLFWASTFALAAWHPRRAARNAVLVLGAVLASALVGGQLYLFVRYGNYLDHRAALVGTGMLPSVKQQLWFDRVTFGKAVLVPPLVWTSLVLVARWLSRNERGRARDMRVWLAGDLIALSAMFVLFASPDLGRDQGRVPDALYFSAVGQVIASRTPAGGAPKALVPGPRTPSPVERVARAKPDRAQREPMSVVFIITESVRAASACSRYEEWCEVTPFTNRLLPTRHGLTQMRALDSTTAISLAVLWLGIEPTSRREDFHTMPIVWEYAAAAGFDTAYFTSQNLFFANSGTWLEGIPARLRVSGTEIDPEASYETGADDEILVNHAIEKIGTLQSPYLAVVHLSNTHFPYRTGDDAPFETDDKYKDRRPQLNRYEDSIYRQDAFVAALVSGVRNKANNERTAFVFVSDHGEQLHEKGAVGHTGTVFDVEVRVPFWIDAPTLGEHERAALRARENTPTTQIDVLPTVLDLLGIWEAPEMAAFRAKLPGASLLRGGSPMRTWTLTNCSPFWTCAFKNWGAIRGSRKILAHQGDENWQCFDVHEDPGEKNDLGVGACEDLRAHVERAIPGRPF